MRAAGRLPSLDRRCFPRGASDLAAGELKSSKWKKLLGYMRRGELVPDEIVLDHGAAARPVPAVCRLGFVLDGFPRTVDQAGSSAKNVATGEPGVDRRHPLCVIS